MMRRPGIRGKLLIHGLLTVTVALALVVAVVSAALWRLGWQQARERLTQATQVVSRSLSTRIAANSESATHIAADKELVGKTGFLQEDRGKSDLRDMLVVERRNLALSLGRAMAAARASEAAIYGMDGRLLCGAGEIANQELELWCPDDRTAGQFLRLVTSAGQTPQPEDWRQANPPDRLSIQMAGAVGAKSSAGCVVLRDTLYITAAAPIMGLKLNATTFVAEPMQHGVLVLRKPIGPAFVQEQCELTGTRINLYVGDKLSAGMVNGYAAPKLRSFVPGVDDGLVAGDVAFSAVDVADGSFFAASSPVIAGGVNVGSAAIMRSQAEMRRSVMWVTVLTIAVGMVAALAAVAVGLAVSRAITRPLRVLVERTTYIAQHRDLDQKIDIRSDDEIGQLATAFNGMVGSLRLYYSDLQKSNEQLKQEIGERAKAEAELARHHDHLEQLVAQRTAELTQANQQLAIDIDRRTTVEKELRASREAAEAANRAKSEFLANMSHEIRTPMTAILGFAELLLSPDLSSADRLNHVHIILRNGQNLLTIINDILDLSKIEAGRMTVEKTPCSLRQILDEVASLMQPRAMGKNVDFNVAIAPEVPALIACDSIRLRQIVMNLVGNAIKFTEIGSVRVAARIEASGDPTPRLLVDIIDTGPGLMADQLAMLFTPFNQADTTTTRKFGGTGLGLTISRRLAQLLGGDVTVRSIYGQGSTFTLELPSGSVAPSATAPSKSIPLSSPVGDPQSIRLDADILLAEDGLDNQALISHHLKRAGATVTIADDGRKATTLALAAGQSPHPFAVILMDMQMPVMDGYAATQLLRDRGYRGAIIALTAHAMDSDRAKCLQAGCDDYLTKPVNRGELLNMIARHLASTARPSFDATACGRQAVAPGEVSL